MKKNVIFLLTLLFFVPLSIIAFNAIVDPYNTFGLELRPSNIILSTTNRRIVTPGIIRRYQPDCIITGSSRVGRGMNPSSKELPSSNCLNLFFNAGDAFEVATLIEFAISMDKKLKTLLVGIDFFMFDEDLDEHEQSSAFDPKNYSAQNTFLRILSNYNFTFSTDAFITSLSKLKEGHHPISSYKDIQLNSFHDGNGERNGAHIDITRGFARQLVSLVTPGRGHNYYGYHFSNKKKKALIDAVVKAVKKGIDVRVFINPEHTYFFYALDILNMFPDFFALISDLAYSSSEYGFLFYNFDGPSSVTNPIHNENYISQFPDAGHYSMQIGDIMLQRMFKPSSTPLDFGSRIARDNYDIEIKKMIDRYEDWKKDFKFDFELLNSLKQCFSFENKNLCTDKIVLSHFKRANNILRLPTYRKDISYSSEFVENLENLLAIASKRTSQINTERMIKIQGGKFITPYFEYELTVNDSFDELIIVQDFLIDKFEVTIGDWLKAGFPMPHEIDPNATKNYPITHVTWDEAMSYCVKLGKRLPTEWEWMISAGVKNGRYSWGDIWPNCDLAYFNGPTGVGCGTEHISDIREEDSSYLQGPYNVSHILGNSAEWVIQLNDYDAFYARKNSIKAWRMLKGGGYLSEEQYLRIRGRFVPGKEYQGDITGFRCALGNVR